MTRRTVLAALFLLGLAVCSNAQKQEEGNAAIQAATRKYLESGEGEYRHLLPQFQRLPVASAEELLAEGLKSKDPEVLKRTLALATTVECGGVVKQAEKLTKSKDASVSALAVATVIAHGDDKQRKKALAQFLDATEAEYSAVRDWSCRVIQDGFSRKFADELVAALSKLKPAGSAKEQQLVKWLAWQLGRPDLDKSTLLKDYKALLEQQEKRHTRTAELSAGLEYEPCGSVSNSEFGNAVVAGPWLTPDGGKALVMITQDGEVEAKVRGYAFETGERLFETPLIDGMYPGMVGLRESAGDFIVRCDNALQRYSLEDGTLKGAVRLEQPGTMGCLCDGGNAIIVFNDNRVWVAGVETGKTIRELYQGTNKTFRETPAASADGKFVAVSFWTGTGREHVIRVYEVASGKMVAELPNAGMCVGFRADEELILYHDVEKHHRVLNHRTGKVAVYLGVGPAKFLPARNAVESWCVMEETDAFCHVVSTETGQICASIRPPCDTRVRWDPLEARISTDGKRVVAVMGSYLVYAANRSPDEFAHTRICFWQRKAD
ncbi:MAG: hypothetical protein M5U25_00145 [Planctomycetota bacterium]|nr:hypothetical protein [Planctomycetota bacterium]